MHKSGPGTVRDYEGDRLMNDEDTDVLHRCFWDKNKGRSSAHAPALEQTGYPYLEGTHVPVGQRKGLVWGCQYPGTRAPWFHISENQP
jgi:hypothetical protein